MISIKYLSKYLKDITVDKNGRHNNVMITEDIFSKQFDDKDNNEDAFKINKILSLKMLFIENNLLHNRLNRKSLMTEEINISLVLMMSFFNQNFFEKIHHRRKEQILILTKILNFSDYTHKYPINISMEIKPLPYINKSEFEKKLKFFHQISKPNACLEVDDMFITEEEIKWFKESHEVFINLFWLNNKIKEPFSLEERKMIFKLLDEHFDLKKTDISPAEYILIEKSKELRLSNLKQLMVSKEKNILRKVKI